MKIIPAIDLIGGQCVRLTQGDYQQVRHYHKNPVDQAKTFEDLGFKHLHLVDLDGARERNIVNYKTLGQICQQTNLIVDFGGGLKSEADVQIAFEQGAKQLTIGSLAAWEPKRFLAWLSTYGPEKIILGADCRNRLIATAGWKEQTDLDVIDYIKNYMQHGLQWVTCTDIARDGMLNGPAVELYQAIVKETNAQLIASGGVSSLADLEQLRDLGCAAAIVGKAIYENRIDLQKLAALC